MKKHLLLGLLFIPFLLALKSGEVAPAFSAKNQDGRVVQLSDFNGKYVLIYFYPKDDTPGCTQEACEFRNAYKDIISKNAVILGVSKQDEKSHLKFKAKHHLPFDLLSDPEGTLASSYGVGTHFLFGLTKRKSVLIGPDKKVVRFYETVDPKTHTQEVLADLNAELKKPKS